MAGKLPWFKFYVQDWITDPRVLSLTNEQRGIFHWLLCRQWLDGDLPGDVLHIYPLLPPGSDSAAVAYVLAQFFPADPDTTRRANPKLAEQQHEMGAAHGERATRLAKARAAKSLKHNTPSMDSSMIEPMIEPMTGGRTRSKNQNQSQTNLPDRQADDMLDPFVFKVAEVANQALRDNPAVRNAEVDFRPMQAALASQAVEDWRRAGVAEATILGAVAGVCARFTPTPENRRIGSWRYFDQAVLRAHAEAQPKVDPMDAVIQQMQQAHERGGAA